MHRWFWKPVAIVRVRVSTATWTYTIYVRIRTTFRQASATFKCPVSVRSARAVFSIFIMLLDEWAHACTAHFIGTECGGQKIYTIYRERERERVHAVERDASCGSLIVVCACVCVCCCSDARAGRERLRRRQQVRQRTTQERCYGYIVEMVIFSFFPKESQKCIWM